MILTSQMFHLIHSHTSVRRGAQISACAISQMTSHLKNSVESKDHDFVKGFITEICRFNGITVIRDCQTAVTVTVKASRYTPFNGISVKRSSSNTVEINRNVLGVKVRVEVIEV